ncbi:MAG: GTP-binding protein, partial [Pseudomonadota bacterium]
LFWKAVPKDDWPDDPEYLASIHKLWKEPFGDMRQELVFIGQDLDESGIRQALDDCLLTVDEMRAGANSWTKLEDPFPRWPTSENEPPS